MNKSKIVDAALDVLLFVGMALFLVVWLFYALASVSFHWSLIKPILESWGFL